MKIIKILLLGLVLLSGCNRDQTINSNDDVPIDVDREGIRKILSDGSDPKIPMIVDFFLVIPDKKTGETLGPIINAEGFTSEIQYNRQDDVWSLKCSRRMLLTSNGLAKIQLSLGDIAKPYGGKPNGWGTFGNKEQ